jgi:hypothetical protein
VFDVRRIMTGEANGADIQSLRLDLELFEQGFLTFFDALCKISRPVVWSLHLLERTFQLQSQRTVTCVSGKISKKKKKKREGGMVILTSRRSGRLRTLRRLRLQARSVPLIAQIVEPGLQYS